MTNHQKIASSLVEAGLYEEALRHVNEAIATLSVHEDAEALYSLRLLESVCLLAMGDGHEGRRASDRAMAVAGREDLRPPNLPAQLQRIASCALWCRDHRMDARRLAAEAYLEALRQEERCENVESASEIRCRIEALQLRDEIERKIATPS